MAPRVLKFILIGDSGVGKSSIMNRFVNDQFDHESYHTIGVEFLTKLMTINNQQYSVQLWDTAGQERFRSLRTPFYRGADLCVLVYSVDDLNSFNNLRLWKDEFIYYAGISDGDFPFVVVGNKTDVSLDSRQVLTSEAERFCSDNFSRDRETPLIETSALDGANVRRCFESAVELAAEYQAKQGEITESETGRPGIRLGSLNRTENGGCC